MMENADWNPFCLAYFYAARPRRQSVDAVAKVVVSFAGLKMHFYLYRNGLIWRSFVESFADDHGFILLHKSIFSSEGCLNPFDYTTCFDAKN